ncbi:MAG TPA: hypothetical protein VNN17_12365 [Terriglobia bacterium]|nr:hypothetical protein [Terriglobia bacterium]
MSLTVPTTFTRMGFTKTFFKNISELLEEYYKSYPCSAVTLTLRVLGEEYHVAKILRADDTLLTFSYYSSPDKAQPLSDDRQEKTGETIAWPAITVPYEAILLVELNPGQAAREREIGFTVPRDL